MTVPRRYPREFLDRVLATLVPPELWVPNTPLWIQLDDDLKVVRVWRRKESEE